MHSQPTHLNIGVVLVQGVLPLDFFGPTTLFFGLSPKGPLSGERVSHTITTYYLGPTLTPVEIAGGAKILPDYTFDQVRNGEIKLDAVLVPGAEDMAPNDINSNAREFLTWAVPELTYVLTVCTGSWLLATTGALDGKTATTNKAAYAACISANPNVNWISHARWAVDGKFWTSSGVSAGMDMACAFIESLVGETHAGKVKAFAEYTSAKQDDDPWAKEYGL